MPARAVSRSSVITAEGIGKDYAYYKKEPGLRGSLRNLFHREPLLKSAVNDLSFRIPRGAITGLIGLNGAGKTTTLKMLSGLIMPSRGRIDVLGYRPFDKKKEYLRRISMVMGNKSQLWWDLPALDSFELNRTIYGVEDKDYRDTLRMMVALLGVEELVNVQVRRLSLGERMKMELIAALLHKPDVIFLDEPTIGLDVVTQHNIREFLKRYCAAHASTVILTSHNFNDIVSLCDSLILLDKGEKIYADTFDNFKRDFLSQKYFILKLNAPNADGMIEALGSRGSLQAEKVEDNAVRISADPETSLDILKDISNNFIEELSDINIENIGMEDVIRRIYGR